MYYVTENFGDNWPDVEFLVLAAADIVSIPSTLSKLINLKYFDLHWNNLWVGETNETKVANDLLFLCDLNELLGLRLDVNGNVVLPECAYEATKLTKVEWVMLELAAGLDIRLFEKPQFRGISMLGGVLDIGVFGNGMCLSFFLFR